LPSNLGAHSVCALLRGTHNKSIKDALGGPERRFNRLEISSVSFMA
jgi:hypothetical protein